MEDNKCGHINKHSMNTLNQLDNLVCTKDRGHDGNHGAEHEQYIPASDGLDLIVIGKRKVRLEKVWCEWTDAAGVLVSEIKPEVIVQSEVDRIRAELIKQMVGDVPKGTLIG